jgi:hypothetical protein
MKNKKLILASLFASLVVLALMGGRPTELLIGFVAAGVIPGFDFTVGPYMMVALTVATTIVLCYKLYRLGDTSDQEEEMGHEKPVRSLKITSRTHHRSAKRQHHFTQLEFDLEERQ